VTIHGRTSTLEGRALDQLRSGRRFVFQFRFLLPDFTAVERDDAAARRAQVHRRGDETAWWAKARRAQLGVARRQRLSGGEQQRV
jgi:ABC-type lipoprotein export system ATPase subunit